MTTTLGRPKIPVLSRDRIIKAALKIIDKEGLDALTTRRLASDLGVKGASLYNHFRDKEDLVVAVAEYVLTRVPKRMLADDVPSETLLLWGVVGLRDALLANPNLIPVLIRHASLGLANREAVTARLIEGDVPAEDVLLLHESLERWAIGSAVRETTALAGSEIDSLTKDYPALTKAAKRQRATAHQMFETVAAGIIHSILNAGGRDPVRPPASASRARKSTAGSVQPARRPTSRTRKSAS